MEINKILNGKVGIYIITNITSGNRYIGSSKDLGYRLRRHFWDLSKNQHACQYLQNSYNKYGENSFIYCILEFCSVDDRWEREQYYIDLIKPEYNIQKQVIEKRHSVETIEKIRKSILKKYSEGFNTVKNHFNVYVYNIENWTLAGVFNKPCDAAKVLTKNKGFGLEKINNTIFKKKYVVLDKEYMYISDLKNFVFQNILQYKTNDGSLDYLIVDDEGIYNYFRTTADAVRFMNASSSSTLKKHKNATIDDPYIVPNTIFKVFHSHKYLPLKFEAVLIEKSLELSEGKIGESPTIEDNTEVNLESKDSKSPQSVEVET